MLLLQSAHAFQRKVAFIARYFCRLFLKISQDNNLSAFYGAVEAPSNAGFCLDPQLPQFAVHMLDVRFPQGKQAHFFHQSGKM